MGIWLGNISVVKRVEVDCAWLVLIAGILLYELRLWSGLQQRCREKERERPSHALQPCPSSSCLFSRPPFALHFIHLQLALGGPSLNSIQGFLLWRLEHSWGLQRGGGGVASAVPTGSSLSDQAESAAPGLPSQVENPQWCEPCM